MRFVNKRMVIAINQMCVDLSGGTAFAGNNIRKGQNLSFVDHIFYNEIFGQKIYNDIYHQAAAYLFHIVKNHSFIDGNKRTGLACALTFLQWNGYYIQPMDADSSYELIIEVAAGPNQPEQQLPQIAAWLESISEYSQQGSEVP